MEKPRIDKLFSDKLRDQKSSPDADSWNRIEQALDKKARKNIWPWLSIAASAALVLVSSWYLLNREDAGNKINYTYAETQKFKLNVPSDIILVPVIIYVVPTQADNHSADDMPMAKNEGEIVQSNTKLDQTEVLSTENKVLDHKLAPVLIAPLPISGSASEEEIAMATTKEAAAAASTNLVPLTIIYKQGEPKYKSKFTQALNYMGEVRNGDKKLVNFKKLKENIQAKFKSNKDVNSP
jgi:hypothetical protein